MFNSIRWSLQLWHAGLLSLVLAGFGTASYYGIAQARYQEVDAELERLVQLLAVGLRPMPPSRGLHPMPPSRGLHPWPPERGEMSWPAATNALAGRRSSEMVAGSARRSTGARRFGRAHGTGTAIRRRRRGDVVFRRLVRQPRHGEVLASDG
jgi:hypothetical protein